MSWQSPTIYSPSFDARNRGNREIKKGEKRRREKHFKQKNYLERKSRNCVESRI
jgi:hypothetical protein